MKLLAEMLAGVVACGAVYYLARPDRYDTVTELKRHDGANVEPAADSVAAPVRPRAIAIPSTRAVRTADAGPSAEEQHAMATLRNEVIVAVSADMQLRGEDVMRCLVDVELAGVEKLRFAVDVVSTAHEARTGQWRFVEIVDGEPLPASFAACANRALGGNQHLAPPKDFQFPSYRGELDIVYTIPAPPPDSSQ